MVKNLTWRYCVVGNIRKTHSDADGTLRYGTAAFTGGTKVYLCGKYWNRACGRISALGLSRGNRYQVADTAPALIENIRCKKVYRPAVLRIMNDWEFTDRWWGNTPADKEEAEAFAAQWWQSADPSTAQAHSEDAAP